MNKVSIPRYFVLHLLVFCSSALTAQKIDQSAYQNLDYRMIGPFRASRTVGGVGVPSQPNVFYMGLIMAGFGKPMITAIIDYFLNKEAATVKLEILKPDDGTVIRTYSSTDPDEEYDTIALAHPTYWIKPQQKLGTNKGQHRFIWDLKYEPPRGSNRQFSIAATYKGTPSGPVGPLVLPGNYTVRLTVDDEVYEKTLTVRLDPRVKVSNDDLLMQRDLSKICYDSYHQLQDIVEAIDSRPKVTDQLRRLRGSGAAGEPDLLYGSIRQTSIEAETLVGLQNKFLFMLKLLQSADSKISTQAMEGIDLLKASLEGVKARWDKF